MTAAQPLRPSTTATDKGAVLATLRRLPGRDAVIGGASALVVLAVAAHYVSAAGVGAPDILRFGAYWALAVLLPGWLVYRSLCGPSRLLLGDLGLAACTGLALEIAAWVVFSLVGAQQLLWVWPFVTLPLLALPRLRRRIVARCEVRMPWWGSGSLAIALAILLRNLFHSFLSRSAWPTQSTSIYPDLQWHLGLIEEAKRSFPLGTPQVVGAGDLHYHFFANAHLAVASLVSGVPSAVLLLKMWMIPFLFITVAVVVGFTDWMSRSMPAATVAGVLATATTSFGWWRDVTGSIGPFAFDSPSQIYALPLMCAVAYQACRVVYRYARYPDPSSADGADGEQPSGPATGDWILLGLLGLGILGAKASATPTLLGGAALVWLAAVSTRRTRANWRAFTVLAVAALVLTYVAQKLAAGGTSGAGWQLLSELRATPLYAVLISHSPDPTPLLLPGIFSHGAAVAAALLVGDQIRLLAIGGAVLAALLVPLTRRDLRVWFLCGCCLAALAAFWAIQHRGLSQYYFIFGVIPIGVVLWCTVLGRLLRVSRATSSIGLITVAIGFLVGGVLTWVGKDRLIHGGAQMAHAARDLVVQTAALAAIVAVITVLVYRWGRRRGRKIAASVVPVAFAVGLLLAPVAQALEVPPVRPVKVSEISRERAEAATWIQANTPVDALFATNRQCLGKTQTDRCVARSWWISGFGGRRVLLEGWSYTPQSANNNPFVDHDLWLTNQNTFITGAPQDMAALRAMGVKYLVADRTATAISPSFWEHTEVLYQTPRIAVVEFAD